MVRREWTDTLRGTRPRWALEFDSLNRVLALEPEIVLPSHGPAIRGSKNSNERGWLAAGIRDAERRLQQ
jgi:hypothetical protein